MVASRGKRNINLVLLVAVATWAGAAQAFCFSFGFGQRNNSYNNWRGPHEGFQPYPWQAWPASPLPPGANGALLPVVPPPQWDELRMRQLPVIRY
ncbi:MAG: hypothetical protein OEZ09_16965 [Betaproteobacteria bacterium]|nr:hypothetical protein [Betaproteobacteria bacterium]